MNFLADTIDEQFKFILKMKYVTLARKFGKTIYNTFDIAFEILRVFAQFFCVKIKKEHVNITLYHLPRINNFFLSF